MTRKDYIKIAQWIRQYKIVELTDRRWPEHEAIYGLMDILEKDNPAFDEDRFMRYINTTIEMEGLTDE